MIIKELLKNIFEEIKTWRWDIVIIIVPEHL